MALKTFAKNTAKQFGRHVLKSAFPGVYSAAHKYRKLTGKYDHKPRNPTVPLVVQAIMDLEEAVKTNNDITLEILDAIRIQNVYLEQLVKVGIKSASGGGLIDSVLNAIGGILGGAAGLKGIRSLTRKFRGGGSSPIKGGSIGKIGRLGRGVARLGGAATGGILSGAIEGYDEYQESGDLFRAATVGGSAAVGAAAGVAIGGVLIPIPILGSLIGGYVGGMIGAKAGKWYLGDKKGSSPLSKNIDADEVRLLAADTLTIRAQEILFNSLLSNNIPGGGQNSVYAKGGVSSVPTPVFRRGIGGADPVTGDRSNTGGVGPSMPGRSNSGSNPSAGPVGETANKGDVAGRPDLKGKNLSEALPGGTERFFHQSGRVEGVDQRLINVLKSSSKDLPAGYRVEMISGHDARSTGTKNHPGGVAVDVKIYDDKGHLIPHNGNSPGWKYYEQLYQSVRERGKVQYPGTEFIWGGAWVGSAAGPGDPMHYQIRSNIPGTSQSSGMYNPETGFDNNSGISGGINFKANAMSREEREAYRKRVRDNINQEQQPTPQTAPAPVPETPPTNNIAPATDKFVPIPKEAPKTSSYNIDSDKAVKAYREKSGFLPVSDSYIKGQMEKVIKEKYPSLKYENSTLTGDEGEIQRLRDQLKNEYNVDANQFIAPVRKPPVSVPNQEVEKLRRDRDQKQQKINQLQKEMNVSKDKNEKGEASEETPPPPKDNSRSDRAMWNINEHLHRDEYALYG